ncbi:ABC transporter substrate-binding protein [Thermodesulfobacteriota bacterium]
MKAFRKRLGFVCFFIIFFVPLGLTSAEEVGVSDTSIKIGATIDTTGPVAGFGIPRVEIVRAYIKYVNDRGGINGRKIEYFHESDDYKPPRTVAAFKKLTDVNQVFCFIGSMGSPTNQAVIPMAQQKKVPYLFIGASDREWYEPPKRYIFTIWPTYEDSMRRLVDYVGRDLNMKNAKVAIIYYVSPSGRQSVRGLKEQMVHYPGMKVVADEGIKYGTVDLSAPVYRMRKANPDVVLFATIFNATALLAKEMKKVGWQPMMVMNISNGLDRLITLGGTAVEGAVSQMIYPMLHEDRPGVNLYKEVCKNYIPDSKLNPSPGGISGFLEMQLGLEAIKRAGRNLTREGLINTLEHSYKNVDIQSIPPVTYSPKKHWGLDQTILVKVKKGKFVKEADYQSPR